MDDLNPTSISPSLGNLTETTGVGKNNRRLYYIIVPILILCLVISLFFVNHNYQKTQLGAIEIEKLHTEIANLNIDISKKTDLINQYELLKVKKDAVTNPEADNQMTDLLLGSYLARGRDTSRMAGIKEISTAIATYSMDTGHLPDVPKSGCIPSDALLSRSYLQKIPIDPMANRYSPGCDGSDGMTYAYRKTQFSGTERIILAVEFETEKGGNSALSIDEIMKLENPIKYIDEETKRGSGKYYIVSD